MYASFTSVTAKNGKILTPTRTGNFLLTSMDPEFYATRHNETGPEVEIANLGRTVIPRGYNLIILKNLQ